MVLKKMFLKASCIIDNKKKQLKQKDIKMKFSPYSVVCVKKKISQVSIEIADG